MHFSLITLTYLSTLAVAREAFSDASSFDSMLKRGASLLKRQEGYYPDTISCGLGDTCEEACGPNQVECSSDSPFTLYCHSSADGSACCPNASGYSCRASFYCTSDPRGRTYCCPNGIDTPACARQYSLTVSIVQQSSTAVIPSVSISSGAQVVTPATRSSTITSGSTSVTRSSAPASISTPAGTSRDVNTSTPIVVPPPSTAAFSPPPLPTFTGGAAKNLGARIIVFFGAGIAFL